MAKSSRARRMEQVRRQQEAAQRRNRMIGIGLALVLVVVIGIVAWQMLGNNQEEPEVSAAETQMQSERPLADIEPAQRNNYYDQYPEMVIDPENDYEAVIRTDKGDMRLQLFAEEAPQTVNNFVFLANQGFYDGVSFHRVIEDFMAQGGDPSGTGSGGPGYKFGDETNNGLTFDRPGLLAMANAGPGTNGSQFFITFAPTPWLNGNHTIFGEVIEGQEVLSQLTRRQPGPGAATPPGDVIQRIDIYESEG